MRHKFFIFFLIIITCKVNATECVYSIFQYDKINLSLCQNYSNYNEVRCLLFKARAEVLNNYIVEKIKNGQLQNKTFEISIQDECLTYRHLDLTQGKNGYYIDLSGFPTLNELKTLIDYFSRPDWQPFYTSNYQTVSEETLKWQIRNFYTENQINKNEQTFIDSFYVWKLDSLSLIFSNDELKYFICGKKLSIKATSTLPIKIKNRYLLFQSDSIFILENQKIILKIKDNKLMTTDYDIYIFDKWVNIGWGGEDNWYFSYSYEKNKFYKRPEE